MVDLPVNIDWGSLLGSIAGYVMYAVVFVFVAFMMYFLFYLTQFQIKAEVYPLQGSGKSGHYSIAKPRKNRVKWIKNKTAWKPLYPMMNKIELEPFAQEFIYAGKHIKAFDYNGTWIPGGINIEQGENSLKAQISPVPHYVRNWQSLQHKKHAAEFAEHSFWEDNKYFIMGVAAVLICCILCGVTIYFSYEYATGGTQAANNLASAIKGFASAKGPT